MPELYMICGPNGAGKTTAAMQLLPGFLAVYDFVNADEIARGLNPLNPEGQALAAGRLMLQRIDSLIADKKSFAFESTGASHTFAGKMKQAKEKGYRLGLVYLWLPHVDFAIHRVQMRVAQGGHSIPEKDIERRYYRGIRNLVHLYLPLVHQASIISSTIPGTTLGGLIAEKRDDRWKIYRPDIWKAIEQTAKETSHDATE